MCTFLVAKHLSPLALLVTVIVRWPLLDDDKRLAGFARLIDRALACYTLVRHL